MPALLWQQHTTDRNDRKNAARPTASTHKENAPQKHFIVCRLLLRVLTSDSSSPIGKQRTVCYALELRTNVIVENVSLGLPNICEIKSQHAQSILLRDFNSKNRRLKGK